MGALKTIAYLIFFVGAGAAALSNPIWGVVNYMIVYQTDPTDTWWGIPLADLGIRFSLVAAGTTMAGMILARKHVPRVAPGFGWWELGMAGLLLIGIINTITGVGFGPVAQQEFDKFWKVMVFTWILGRLAASRANLKIVLWTIVLGSLYVGYDGAAASFVLGRLEAVGGPDFSTTSGTAAHLSAMLPLIGAMFLIAKRWRWKLLTGLSGALTVNTIIMCRTRSAFVGLVIGAATAVLCAPKARRFRIHALLILGATLGFSLTDDQFWLRMATMTDSQLMEADLATVSRKEIWIASMRIIADYPYGVGVGNFTQMIGQYAPRHNKRSSHNSLIVCFVELGVQGGVVFLMLFGGSLYYLYRCFQLANASGELLETKMIVYGMLISLLTYFVTALGTQRFYCESFWWVLMFPLALYRVLRVESTAVDEVSAPAGTEEDDAEMAAAAYREPDAEPLMSSPIRAFG